MRIYQVHNINGCIQFTNYRDTKKIDNFIIENGEVVKVENDNLSPAYLKDD